MPAFSPPVPRDQFRQVCAQFATGVTVVTACDSDGQPHGFTANSFVSVSAEPPLVMVCIDLRCSLIECFKQAVAIGINILAENQEHLSVRFSQSCDPRFDGVEWRNGQTGVPQIAGTLATLECRIINRIPAGDHIVLLGEVVEAEVSNGHPLVFFNSRYSTLEKPR